MDKINFKQTFTCVYCQHEHPTDSDICPDTQNKLTIVHKLTGSTLGNKYQIERFIGEGGMGVIYECNHTALGKKLAVKFLNPELTLMKEPYERFKREAMAAAMISHKNIVSVIDIGEADSSIPYIIMEYLSGEDLSQRIAKWGRIPLFEAREIMLQVLEALSAVHSCGIVHRDLKPENIFIAKQSGGTEIVKVLDFGISRLSRLEDLKTSRITKAGYVYGTPNYISPEQAEGKSNIDHRVDLYAAGIIFYEMITGRLPFEGDNYAKLLVEIITKPVPDPRNFYPEIPRGVVDFIMVCLEKKPEDRFQSAHEMIKELQLLDLNNISTTSKPPSHSTTSDRVWSRTPSQRATTTPIEAKGATSEPKAKPHRSQTGSFYKIITQTPRKKTTTSSKKIDKKTPEEVSSQKAGFYRISYPASEKIDEKSKNEEELKKTPRIPPPPRNKNSLAEAINAIERATTLPTPTPANSLTRSHEVTPTPDRDKEKE